MIRLKFVVRCALYYYLGTSLVKSAPLSHHGITTTWQSMAQQLHGIATFATTFHTISTRNPPVRAVLDPVHDPQPFQPDHVSHQARPVGRRLRRATAGQAQTGRRLPDALAGRAKAGAPMDACAPVRRDAGFFFLSLSFPLRSFSLSFLLLFFLRFPFFPCFPFSFVPGAGQRRRRQSNRWRQRWQGRRRGRAQGTALRPGGRGLPRR